jgi:acetyltransferase-like isoleucine patch superfamily enzyme
VEPLVPVAVEARCKEWWRRRQFASFGSQSILHRPMWLYGTKHAVIGNYTIVMHKAWISIERPAWTLDEPALRIGDRVMIRPFLAISASLSIVIEDNIAIGASCSILDSNHTVRPEVEHVFDNDLKPAPVRIGAGTWLGDHVAVLAGADIGRQCVIGANSVVTGVIPDYSIAVGSPARVVGRTKPE